MKKILFGIMVFMVATMTACAGNTSDVTTTEAFDSSRNITVYTRDTTSGTRDAFFSGIDFDDAVADNSVLATSYVEVDSNGSMITAVTNDIYGIGYISLASLLESGLTGLAFDGIEATEENVINETYALKRPFNYIVRSDWTGMDREQQIVEAFVAYMSTTDGKATIANESGIVSIAVTDVSWDDIKNQYPVCEQDNSDVTIYIGGSTSVENIARALTQEFSTKCGNFVAEHNHTGSGDAYKRTQGSESEGANLLHIGFASRYFKDTEPASVGTTGQICYDAVVVVVNSQNNLLTSLTGEQLKQIFDGQINKWENLD